MTHTLRLVTWNIDGLDNRHLDLRSEAAALTVLSMGPDIAVLQEVVHRSFFAHIRPHFTALGYTLIPAEPPANRGYFCAAASRLPVLTSWRLPFPGSAMGRALTGAVLASPIEGGGPLLVTTAHLESLRPSRQERRRQLAAIAAALDAHPGPALFAGDTNLRDEELAGIEGLDRVDDAWRQLGAPEESRHTWTPRGKARPGMRFDRVFLNRRPGWRAADITRFGEAAVDGTGGMRPSDHLGLLLTLTLEAPSSQAGGPDPDAV